jgi:hypothetical protein
MAAGLGLKTFVTGDVLTAADTNGYLMQGVWVFASAAARSAAVTSPQEGNMSYLKDTNSTEYYSGSAWVPIAGGAASYVGASVYKTGVQSCSNGSDNIVTWDAEYFDTNTIHDNVTNNSRLTVPTGYGGKWLINYQIAWGATSTGAKWNYIYKNGTDVFGTFITYVSAGSNITVSASLVLNLTAGDYIDCRAGQNSGGALNIIAGYSSQLQFSFLGA